MTVRESDFCSFLSSIQKGRFELLIVKKTEKNKRALKQLTEHSSACCTLPEKTLSHSTPTSDIKYSRAESFI